MTKYQISCTRLRLGLKNFFLVTMVCPSFFQLCVAGEEGAVAISTDIPISQQSAFIVQFSKGTAWNPDLAPQQQNGFKQHSENLQQLRAQKRISFGARYDDFGMIFLHATSLQSARSLIQNDPGVKAGIFQFTVSKLNVFYPWQPVSPEP